VELFGEWIDFRNKTTAGIHSSGHIQGFVRLEPKEGSTPRRCAVLCCVVALPPEMMSITSLVTLLCLHLVYEDGVKEVCLEE